MQTLSTAELRQFPFLHGHIHVDAIQKLMDRPPVVITMLREPLRRTRSHFAYEKQQGLTVLTPEVYESLSTRSLEEFLQLPASREARYQNVQTTLIATRFNDRFTEHWQRALWLTMEVPQTPAEMLANARNLLGGFAFFGISDRFADSLLLLAYVFGWPPARLIPYLNVTQSQPVATDVSVSAQAGFEDLNTLDREVFQYASQLFEHRFQAMTDRLVQRYGSRHHRKARHLSYEDYCGLLEQHYETRAGQRRRAIWPVRIDFSKPVIGSNWYAIEKNAAHGYCRWTGPQVLATLDLLLPAGRRLVIRMKILATLQVEILDSLKLNINGWPILLSRAESADGSKLYTGYIAPYATLTAKGFSRLNFRIDHTAAPNTLDPHNADTRLLGILVNWIEILPAGKDGNL